jgi:bacterioferritin (cytochrome b1)
MSVPPRGEYDRPMPTLDPRDPGAIRLLNYYRDAELRGAELLLHLGAHETEAWACASLTRHIADEARHASLITQRIAALGAAPEAIRDGYQRRMGRAAGIPRTVLELYAITLIAEERARARYVAHLDSGIADPETAVLLRAISADEVWHLEWVRRRLDAFARAAGGALVDATLQRYADADAIVSADLAMLERQALGFSIAAPEPAAPRW